MPLETVVTRPHNSLVAQALEGRFTPGAQESPLFSTTSHALRNHEVNGDGFGVCWYPELPTGEGLSAATTAAVAAVTTAASGVPADGARQGSGATLQRPALFKVCIVVWRRCQGLVLAWYFLAFPLNQLSHPPPPQVVQITQPAWNDLNLLELGRAVSSPTGAML